MKVLRSLVLLLLLLVILGAAGVVWLTRHGVSARAQPGRVETLVAGQLRRLAIPREAREERNPLSMTPAVLKEAREHFADHCALCHANDGSGQTEIGQGLYPKAPDMRRWSTQKLSDGELYYIIENGVRFTGMPGWGDGGEHSRKDSWALVHFIRRLAYLTPADVEAMKKLNPRSPHEMEEEREAEAFLKGEDSSTKAASPRPPAAHHH
jgi:mono/diheme cytochrome c family protein